MSADPAAPPHPTLAEATRFWWLLGLVSFGGPAGQIALMHRELVERRRWISDGRFLHALNYCMLLPGPEAQQLATYIGWLLHRTPGGLIAGGLFVLPSLLLLIALSWVYLSFGHVAWVAGLFYGLKPAVVALVAQAAWRIGQRTLRHPLLWALAAAALAASLLQVPFPAVVLAAALVGLAVGRRWPAVFSHGRAHGRAAQADGPALIDDHTPPPAHARSGRRHALRVLLAGIALWALLWGLLALTGQPVLADMAGFFTRAALLTFGGAYAVLPYVVQGAVEQHGWLTHAQMMDGLALGETTPGPLIMVVAFVGFVGGWTHALFGPEALPAAGIASAAVVTVFTFLPSFVFILAGGPLVEATHGRTGFTAPLTAITAAVVGVIAELALFFARAVLWPQGLGQPPDWAAAAIAWAAALALMRLRWGVLPVLAGCAAAGLLVSLARG